MAGGPMVRPSIQMEKKMAFMPPSRMRGMSMWPSGLRLARSKDLEKKRWVVSSWVSRTMEEKCSFLARSEMSSPWRGASSGVASRIRTAMAARARRQRIRFSLVRRNSIGNSIWRKRREEILPYQPAEERLFPCLAIDFGERFGERNFLGTGVDTVLRVGTILNAAGLHDGVEAFVVVHGAGGMHVKEAHLADDGGADEIAVGTFAGDLRANFEAAAAGDAGGKLVGFFLRFGSHARAFAEIVGAIDGDPGFDALEAVKHKLAIHGKVADNGKFRERFETDGLIEFVHKSGAGHAGFAVDEHGAGAANFFEAVGVVGDGSGLFAVAGDRIFGNVAKTDDDVHRGTPEESELFPVRSALRADLTLDFDDDLFFGHESSAVQPKAQIQKPAPTNPR